MNTTTNATVTTAQIESFVSKCQELINSYFATNYKNLTPPVLTIDAGKRYARIVRNETHGSGRSVYCFVDMTNGDVLKSATWKAPAKHARGNLNDASQGMANMSSYGAAYMR